MDWRPRPRWPYNNIDKAISWTWWISNLSSPSLSILTSIHHNQALRSKREIIVIACTGVTNHLNPYNGDNWVDERGECHAQSEVYLQLYWYQCNGCKLGAIMLYLALLLLLQRTTLELPLKRDERKQEWETVDYWWEEECHNKRSVLTVDIYHALFECKSCNDNTNCLWAKQKGISSNSEGGKRFSHGDSNAGWLIQSQQC